MQSKLEELWGKTSVKLLMVALCTAVTLATTNGFTWIGGVNKGINAATTDNIAQDGRIKSLEDDRTRIYDELRYIREGVDEINKRNTSNRIVYVPRYIPVRVQVKDSAKDNDDVLNGR